MSIRFLNLVALAGILGCAASSGNSASLKLPRTANYLTGEEIISAHANEGTAYDAVARLRPNWLVGHGVAVQGSEFAMVFVDGQQYGPPESLRNIQAYHVTDIRYYDITQAGARFGIRGGTGGVIEVRIRTK